MTLNIYTKISLRVIMLFIIAILFSLIPDVCNLHPLFDDTFCTGKPCTAFMAGHLPEYHWGYRHWLWAIMGFVLFIIQSTKIISLIEIENYND